MEETMFDADRRPMGRLFYWLLAVVTIAGCGLTASGAAPVPQSGLASTTVADTIYMADGSAAQGNLIITWPAFVTPPAASKSFDSSMSISNAQSSIAVGGCTGRISRFDLIFGLGKSATFGWHFSQ
jgi:hypothetical protein